MIEYSPITKDIRKRISDALGDECIVTKQDEVGTYSKDASGLSCPPELVIRVLAAKFLQQCHCVLEPSFLLVEKRQVVHALHLTATITQALGDGTDELVGDVDDDDLDRLLLLTVLFSQHHLRHAEGELVTLAPHGLGQDGDHQLAAAVHHEGVGRQGLGGVEEEIDENLGESGLVAHYPGTLLTGLLETGPVAQPNGKTMVDVLSRPPKDGTAWLYDGGSPVRVFRGGGLTKDASYLRGLVRLLNYIQDGGMIEPLLVGKIGADEVPVINELLRRKVLRSPPLRPRYLEDASALARLEAARKKEPLLKILFEKASKRRKRWTTCCESPRSPSRCC